LWVDGLGDSEIDDFRHGAAVVKRHKDIGRLDVPVNDPFLVRMVHGATHRNKQFQTVSSCQLALITELGNGNTSNELHDKIGTSGRGHSGIEHPRNIRMIHHGERLPLGSESEKHFACIHARLKNFEGDFAPHWLDLLCDKYMTKAPFANDFHELVPAHDHPRELVAYRLTSSCREHHGWSAHEARGSIVMSDHESLDLSEQFEIWSADSFQVISSIG
jgi:hypothetical protein